MTTATKPQRSERRDVIADPAEFHKLVGATTYDKQDEMMRAVFASPRVAVVGANGTGKDFEAARIALAWLSLYKRSKVIVIAPTHRQVEDVFWNEMRTGYRSKATTDDWGFRILPRSPRIESETEPEERFGVGFATSDPAAGTNEMPTGKGLQGYHSPNLLAIISEAHAVHQSHIDEIRRLNPRCLLMTGNPFVTSGEFFDAFHDKQHLYHTIRISAFDTPNLHPAAPRDGYSEFPGMVARRDVDDRRDEWGEDSPLYIAGVLGQFPDNLDDMIVVPRSMALLASNRTSEATGRVILAVDVARFGKDKTVVIRRQGNVARIIYRIQGNDTMATAGWVGRYCDDHPEVDIVVVDETGLGGGTLDRLNETGAGSARLIGFQGGASASETRLPNGQAAKDRFVNANAEVWWAMRDWYLKEDADTDNDPTLIAQVSSRSYSIQSDKKIKLQSKEDMLKSPDEADALAMTFTPIARPPSVTFA